MSIVTDDPELTDSRLRPSLRPWLIGLTVNAALAAVFLGVPYSWGLERAEAITPRFSAFAACLFAADAAEVPGLALPRRDRARFASMVVNADAGWPGRCRPLLRAIVPEPTRFVFPSVKTAEARVALAVDAVDEELAAIEAMRAETEARRVPDRALRALEALRAALASLGLATGEASLTAEHEAIVLTELDGELSTASLIPLRIAYDSPWAAEVVDGALVVHAMDRRRVGFARVEDGGIEHRLARRRSRVRAMSMHGDPPWLLWATPEDQCGDSGCVHRSTGIAAFLTDQQTLEPMFWLNGHPAGPLEASVAVGEGEARMLALAPDGAELRRFALPAPEVRPLGAEAEVPQLTAAAVWPVDQPADARALWLPNGALWLGGRDRTVIVSAEDGRTETLPGFGESVWAAVGCRGGGSTYVLVTTEYRAVMQRLEDAYQLAMAFREPRLDHRRARLVCDRLGAVAYGMSDDELLAQRCGRAGCEVPARVATNVAAFDAVSIGDEIVVAYTDDVEHGAIMVIDSTGRRVVGPCWEEPTEGMCGAPRLASDGSVTFLVARQEGDLRALRRVERDWRPLRGLAPE